MQTRGDSVNRELLKAMRDANFNSLMFGIETASENLMKLINKNETVQENVDAIRLAKRLVLPWKPHLSMVFLLKLLMIVLKPFLFLVRLELIELDLIMQPISWNTDV